MEITLINQLRGSAFILMFIYHIFVFLKILTPYDYLNNFYINVIGIISRNIFIILIGISLYLSYKNSSNFNAYKKKQLQRSIKIYLIAIYITLFTYCSIYEYYIVFGVLHFISISILILHNYINNFIVLFLILFISLYFNYNPIYLHSNYSFINYIYNIIGFNVYKNTIDSFPLIKWLPKIILGIYIGYIIHYIITLYKQKTTYKSNKRINKQKKYDILSLIGKNTLLLYIIHMPIIYIIIKYIFNK
jgi:uncharacterized membrane protein